MGQQDRNYWERRAEQELTLAQASSDERVVRAHYELLGLCLDRLYPHQTRHETSLAVE